MRVNFFDFKPNPGPTSYQGFFKTYLAVAQCMHAYTYIYMVCSYCIVHALCDAVLGVKTETLLPPRVFCSFYY